MSYFHCIFIIYLILLYVNDSVRLTKKKTLFLHDFYVMRPLFWLFTIAQGSQHSASRGRVLAFYRIAPCLKNGNGSYANACARVIVNFSESRDSLIKIFMSEEIHVDDHVNIQFVVILQWH